MEIRSTVINQPRTYPKKLNANPNPGAIFADKSGDAVWVPRDRMDPEMRTLMFEKVPSQFLGAFSALAQERAKARGASPAAALPFDLAAIGIANQELFGKACSGGMTGRDAVKTGGVLCSVGKALAVATGQSGAENWLSLGEGLLFAIADFEGEYVWLDSSLDVLTGSDDRKFWDQFADQTTIVSDERVT